MTGQRASNRKTTTATRRWLWLVLLLIGATPALPPVMAGHGGTGAGSETVASLMALLDQRSPGERAKGELSPTKSKRSFQMLSSTSWPDLEKTIAPAPAPLVETSPLAPHDAPTFASLGGFAPGPILPLGSGPVTLGSGSGSGGTSGGGGGGCCAGGLTPTEVPNEIPAVPEPSTWAMLLIGFGAIGTALRRRRALTLRAVA